MIKPENFFVARQPTFPLSLLLRFYNRLLTEPLEPLLREFYKDSIAQQAIFVASPALYQRVERWLAGEILPEQEKLVATLHKYMIRMCSRPTPYGLFAGCLVGGYGERTQLRAGTARTARPYIRLDTDCFLAIRDWLINQPGVKEQLTLFANSSIYPVGSSFRYVEQHNGPDRRHYFISAVEENEYLSTVLEQARTGASLHELARGLVDSVIQPDEAADFVEQLIEGQLLRFEIEPSVTGLYPLNHLIERLANLTGTAECHQALVALRGAIHQTDPLVAHAQVEDWLNQRDIRPVSRDIVQVDTYFQPTDLQLGGQVVESLRRDLEKLLVLNQPYHRPDLDEFKRRFYNRYGAEEVPLSMALDGEFGVGYGTASTLGIGYAPLIDDIAFIGADDTPTVSWDWWQQLVMDKYAEVLRTRQTEIVLTANDLTYIGTKQQPTVQLPYSFYVFGTILASSEKAIDTGNFRFNLQAFRGPSGLSLLSRFCEGESELARHFQEVVANREQYHADVIIAEIVHLPEDRVGNILSRPTTYAYEIPYMGQSSLPLDHQIPLSDLMISMQNDSIILRSKRLNKRVIPRLTNAHNYTNGLPTYRFLCDLQYQDAHLDISWNWGVLRSQPYLPRVRYNNIILRRATWQLNCRDLTPENPLRLVTQLTGAGLPDQFVVAQGDNELYISMHVPASLDLLISEIKKLDQIRLIEFLAHEDQCPLTQKGNRFTHEVIIPFRNTAVQPLRGLSKNQARLLPRNFSVGSEWFYMKVYTGEKTSDTLLLQAIFPAVQQLLAMQIVQQFFFVRYKDPDTHLRLRFKGNPHVEFYQYVVRAMERALHKSVEAGVVYRVQVDTYQRELERYGTAQMGICESLFHCDSLSTLSVLSETGEVFDENMRFALAVHKTDQLLQGAGFTTDEYHAVMEQLKETFFTEFGGDTALRQQLNKKYRHCRPLIDQALSDSFIAVASLGEWADTQRGLLSQLTSALGHGLQLRAIVSSLVHMMVNRLFPSKHQAYELVLYHCLAKHYASQKIKQSALHTSR